MPAKQQEKKKRGRPASRKSTGSAPLLPVEAPASAVSAPGRDEKGRFMKGVSGNPDGRKAIPQEIKDMAKVAPKRLLEIAEAPGTPPRVQADIYKWMAEMAYGKPRQQVDMEAQVESKSIIVELAGELATWGE